MRGQRENKKILRVSTIIPVYNEEKTIAKVVSSLLKSPLIDEVIVVNDGSQDRTLQELEEFAGKITIVNLKLNHGKGFALASGVKKAKGEIINFWDADFTNLSNEHIDTVLGPIIKGEARAVVGYRYPTVPIFNNLSGQRAYRKNDLIPHLENLAKTRFGAEVYLNTITSEKETKKIGLKNLTHRTKYEKFTYQRAFKEYVKAGVEITKALTKGEIVPRRDIEIVNKLYRVGSLQELKSRIDEIANRDVRQIWKDYILKYLSK